jgi:hypothetical protein
MSQVESHDEPRKPEIKVYSHWVDSNMVVLEFEDITATVVAKDIKAAIDNATNTARH